MYAHVPFCRTLCPYCDFTIARSDPDAHAGLARALLGEWRRRGGGLRPRTVYFGGGTPTELPAELLTGLVRELCAAGTAVEVTVEANPESATPATLRALRSAGVTRLSLGVQSTRAHLLELLGRGHGAGGARAAFDAAREAGFDSVNVDLMFGLPGQADADWAGTLDEVLAWRPDHVSAYALELNPRVPMARRIESGRVAPLSEQQAGRHYEHLCARMRGAGWRHYEISNFCLPGHESAHNLGYWQDRPYLGLGPGAHSFDGRDRSWNVRPHRVYARRIEAGGDAEEGRETPTPEQRRLERLFLALRTAGGVELGSLGPGAEAAAGKWAGLQDTDRVTCAAGRLSLTEAGFWYSQTLTADLASALPPLPGDEPGDGIR